MRVNLIVPEPMDSLLEINIENHTLDLHNDYTCTKISYSRVNKEVIINFLADNVLINRDAKEISLIFTEAQLMRIDLPLVNKEQGLCIDSFYRGRIENNDILIDKTDAEEFLFYLDFYEDQSLEILAKMIILEYSPN